jgi:outer membrane protein OmpA-like peptidoglycan-associated protein
LEAGASAKTPATSSAPQSSETESLPWRQHRKDRDAQPAKPTGPKLSAADSRGSGDLAALARRDSRLSYDEQSGIAQVDLEIPFEPGSARLNEDGRKALDDLAKWLRSSPAAELRVMVAGYAEGKQAAQVGDGKKSFANSRQLGTARAQAVADYLDRHGISEDRLGVTGAGSRFPHLAGGESRDAAESVQIYVAEPDAMLVGWGPAGKLR